MRRRDRPLDIFRQMRLVRSPEDMLQTDDVTPVPKKCTSIVPSPDQPPPPPVAKKKLNIPVGDVIVDPAYDTFVPANFTVPSGYIRYIVKLSDEPDPISDYFCDEADEEWIQTKIAGDDKYGYNEHLTKELLEKVINTLEKLTGLGDTVTMKNAERSLRQVMPNITGAVYSRLVTDIYHHWQSKRKKNQKPCCRRYWPVTSATDTNPHMVFRPREKERYRLRKHRKNDLDSYRKLQQLRREFVTAQNLLQLVIEREKLKKANLLVQTEIIAQSIYEIENPGSSSLRVDPSELFTYQLQYPLLLKADPPLATGRKRYSDYRSKSNKGDTDAVERQRPGRKPGAELKRKRASLDAESIHAPPEQSPDVVLTDEATPALFANALLTGHVLYEANTVRLNTLGVPGPPVFLQPIWPSFMNDLPTREKIPIYKSIADYADELELRPDVPLPNKFRCRGRIGRGGRLIMDRVPVYGDESSEYNSSRIVDRDMTYIFPTSLASIHEQARFSQAVRDCKDAKRTVVSSDDIYSAILTDPSPLTASHSYGSEKQSSIASNVGLRNTAGPATLASNRSMEVYLSRCHPVRDLGLAFPLPNLVQPAELSRREHEVYRMPDSDDETIELPRGYIAGPSFPSYGKLASNGTSGNKDRTNNKPVKYIVRA